MNQEIKEKWIKALTSGEYVQGRKRLKSGANEFCCLGVLCDLHRQEIDEETNDWMVFAVPDRDHPGTMQYRGASYGVPFFVREWAGCIDSNLTQFSSMNDKGESFDVIAAKIQEVL